MLLLSSELRTKTCKVNSSFVPQSFAVWSHIVDGIYWCTRGVWSPTVCWKIDIGVNIKCSCGMRMHKQKQRNITEMIVLSKEMHKHIRHVEFISPAPTSEKCKQIHKHNITIQTQHPVSSNLCVKQTLGITDAVQRTSFSKSKAWKHFL